jgi:glycosyltransferase 2 family protein
MKNKLAAITKLIISLAICLYIYLSTNITSALNKIELNNIYLSISVCFLVLFMQLILATFRLKILSNIFNFDRSYFKILYINSIGGLFNHTPLSIIGGDTLRALALNNYNKLGLSNSVKIILIDRVYGFVSLILIMAVSIPYIVSNFIVFNPLIILFFLLLIGVVLVVYPLLKQTKYYIVASEYCVNLYAYFLIEKNKNIINCLLLSLIIQLVSLLAYYLIILILDININIYMIFLIIPFITFVSMIPISINGWGTREFLFLYMLSLEGYSDDRIIFIPVFYGLGLFFSYIPVSVYYSSSTYFKYSREDNKLK